MKNRHLVGLVGAILALIAVGYAARNGNAPKKESSHAGAEHQGHAAAGPQTPEKPQGQMPREEPPSIEIAEDKQKMLGVRTAEASVRPLNQVSRTVGRIDYDERRTATVNAKFEGWIERLYVDFTGMHVKKGEPLAEIYSPELLATQQEFISAVTWSRRNGYDGSDAMKSMLSKDSRSLVDAARQRLALWDISEEQIMKIEQTGKPLRTLTIYSPVSGYVVQKMAVKGMRVMPGEKLFDIADLSSVWVLADIYENELQTIKTGQKATISLSSIPGKEFSSVIEYIYPALSGDTRTAKVRFTIPNPAGQMKPQMFTNVEVKVPLGSRLSVPDEAVLDTGIRKVVYVYRGEGYFEPREVQTGVKAEGYQEIVAGLRAGEKVAASAAFLVDSEAQLKGVQPLSGGHKH